MLNQCVLTETLAMIQKSNFYGEGQPVANFNLAFNSSKKKTGWIRITCFNKLAEIAEKYLHKGARIAVVGALDQRKWEDEGVTKTAFSDHRQFYRIHQDRRQGFRERAQPEDIPF